MDNELYWTMFWAVLGANCATVALVFGTVYFGSVYDDWKRARNAIAIAKAKMHLKEKGIPTD